MNTQYPLVCICIPNYNNEKTISQTLDSLITQTYQNIIIKVFDNASTDESIKILNEYKSKYSRINVFQNPTNIGGEANFTKCIEGMEGEFAAIFHADDLYEPTFIEEQVAFLESHPECGAVAVHAYAIDNNSNITGERLLPKEIHPNGEYVFNSQLELFRMTLKYGNFITCPSVMARTEIYKNKIQQWNGSVFKTSADLDVWLRLASFGKFGFISKPLMKYRVSEASYSYNLARMRTEPHDLFLVLDDYLSLDKISKELTQQDQKNYQFLLFKDRVNRSINLFIQGTPILNTIALGSFAIIRTAITSKQNFMIYLSGIIITILSPLRSIVWLRTMIYRFRFGSK